MIDSSILYFVLTLYILLIDSCRKVSLFPYDKISLNIYILYIFCYFYKKFVNFFSEKNFLVLVWTELNTWQSVSLWGVCTKKIAQDFKNVCMSQPTRKFS